MFAIIDNGVIVNVAVCDDAVFALACGWVELPDGYGIGDLYDAGDFTKKPEEAVAIPVLTVSAAQFRLALSKLGKLDRVLAWVATQEVAAQQAWEYATEFRSDASVIAAAVVGIGVSVDSVVSIFALASTIDINDSATFGL